jgi:activator of 2-hydroxyglutaryl-CoA dehydratase
MEVDLLQVPIGDVGERSFQIDKEPVPVSSTCVVYAKSEATGLLRKGWQTNEVLAAYCAAMADRIFSLLKRVGIEPEFAITGGMAKNKGVVGRLMKKINLEAAKTEWDTQIAGAVGCLFGLNSAGLEGKLPEEEIQTSFQMGMASSPQGFVSSGLDRS